MSPFRIEFLRETTEEDSVCHVIAFKAESIDAAGKMAFAAFADAKDRFGAGGFQIRDMSDEARPIVALETIDTLQRLKSAGL
jgi:hypothetical protein